MNTGLRWILREKRYGIYSCQHFLTIFCNFYHGGAVDSDEKKKQNLLVYGKKVVFIRVLISNLSVAGWKERFFLHFLIFFYE